MFSNVTVDIAFPYRSFVFSQSNCEVYASLTDVGITRTIKLHYYMLHPGSNHLLKNSSFNLYVLSEYELISSWIFVYCILQHTEMELIKNVSKW